MRPTPTLSDMAPLLRLIFQSISDCIITLLRDILPVLLGYCKVSCYGSSQLYHFPAGKVAMSPVCIQRRLKQNQLQT